MIAKAVSVKNYLLGLNSGLTVDAHVTAITSVNAMDLVGSYDVVVDASDNVATRYLLNDACVLGSKLSNTLQSFPTRHYRAPSQLAPVPSKYG